MSKLFDFKEELFSINILGNLDKTKFNSVNDKYKHGTYRIVTESGRFTPLQLIEMNIIDIVEY